MEQLCRQAIDVVLKAGKFIQNEAITFNKKAIEVKGFNQLVSYVDKTAEEMLVDGLSKVLPGSGFITEEETIKTEQKEWMWVIDPLDGTTNFIHQIPVYSVSVGLLHNQIPVMGIVYEVCRDEVFYAWENSPAFLNKTAISVKTNPELSKSLLATGFPYYDFDIMRQYLETLNVLMKSTQGMRRMGSAAVDLAYVACGRFDGFFEYGLHAWDVCGGAFIVQQAGGVVTDFNSGDNYTFGKEIIAASQSIYKPLQHIISTHFNK